MIPLKYWSIFWRTLEMLFINCEINLILTWPANCLKIDATTADHIPTFTITGTNVCILVVVLSTKDNECKIFQQLKSGFKRTIHWNNY